MKRFLFIHLFLVLSVMLYAQSKMSPNTRHLISSLKKTELQSQSIQSIKSYLIRSVEEEKYVNAYIYTNEDYSDAILEEHGVKINTRFPGIITANIPVNKLEAICALKEIKYVQIGESVHKMMDKARVSTMADRVQSGTNLSSPFLGTDVVVGIIDGGFEYGHPNFYKMDKSELRIKRVWDQNGEKGTPPEGFNYGVEYASEEDILNAIKDGSETHGTHVAGTVAGADTIGDNQFYGIASDADIVLVSIYSNDSTTENVSISDGIKYIFDYAESVGKPCVINMSLGMHVGPHDGTSTFDVLADAMQGEGKILVGAAGNEGQDPLHISKTFESTTDSLKSFFNFINRYQAANLDIWGEKGMKYTIQLHTYNPSTKQIIKSFDLVEAPSPEGSDIEYTWSTSLDGMKGEGFLTTEISPLNEKTHTNIQIYLESMKGYTYLGFTIKPLTPGTVHVWADNVYSNLSDKLISGYTKGNSQCSMGEIGGTGKRIISTGAYASRNNYLDESGREHSTSQALDSIATFSSLGPTPDGRMKPDITAPGSAVVSSISSYAYDLSLQTIMHKSRWNNKTYYYAPMEGTSMASPCVTGILATWLQANKDLTPEEIKSILQKTAIHPNPLTTEANNTWGYGKIDAWAGMKEVLSSGISSESIPEIVVLPSENRGFNLLFTGEYTNTKVSVYNLNGEMVYNLNSNNINAGEEISVDPGNIGQGIYVVKVSSDQMTFTSKVAVR